MMTSKTFAKTAGKKPVREVSPKVVRILDALKVARGSKKKRDGVVWSRV